MRSGAPSAAITLKIHPWHGQSVHVLATHGRDFATIENEAGERRIICIRWTSLVPQAAYELPSGAVARLCPDTAHQLAVWVEQRGLAKQGLSEKCP